MRRKTECKKLWIVDIRSECLRTLKYILRAESAGSAEQIAMKKAMRVWKKDQWTALPYISAVHFLGEIDN